MNFMYMCLGTEYIYRKQVFNELRYLWTQNYENRNKAILKKKNIGNEVVLQDLKRGY